MANLNDFNVEIDGKTYEQIFNQVSKLLEQRLKEDGIDELVKELKKAAKEFVDKYEKITKINKVKNAQYNRKQELEKLYNDGKISQSYKEEQEKNNYYHSDKAGFFEAKAQVTRDGKEETLYEYLDKNIAMDFFKSQYKYLNAMHNFLGIKMNFVLVGKDGTIYEESFETLLKKNFNDLFSISFGSEGVGLVLKMKESAFKNDDNKKDFSSVKYSKELLEIYQEIIKRSNYSKAFFNWKSKSIIFWRPSGMRYWQKAFVVSQGDIAEAYAGYMYALEKNELNDDFFRGTIEDKIDVFITGGVGVKRYRNKEKMTFKDFHGIGGVLGVDSLRGTYQGDFSYKNQQYAIKGKGASLQGYSKDIEVAKQIIQKDANISKIIASDYAKAADEASTRNKLKQDADKEAKKKAQELTSSVINKHFKGTAKLTK